MAAGRPIHPATALRYAGLMLAAARALRRAWTFLSDDRAQGLVEYALVVATVSLVAIAAMNLLGRKANNTLSNAANSLS